MTGKSAIEWTEATWNPLVGCSVLSPGCTNCYAMRTAHRMGSNPKTPQYHGITKVVNGKPVWTGAVVLAKHKLLEPLLRRTPTMYFVNSMSDLFHEAVPDETIDRIFAVMALCPQHTFQILTKRGARMRKYMTNMSTERSDGRGAAVIELLALKYEIACHEIELQSYRWPLPNVWLGVSCEDQKRADERIPDLLATPAAIRWVSAEPLLGPIDFKVIDKRKIDENFIWVDALRGGTTTWNYERQGGWGGVAPAKLDWIVVGGESGPDARPMHPDWARHIRDQCESAGVPFFFKQWGAWSPDQIRKGAPVCVVLPDGTILRGRSMFDQPAEKHAEIMINVGKKAAGDLLDGIRHHAWPARLPSPLWGGVGGGVEVQP